MLKTISFIFILTLPLAYTESIAQTRNVDFSINTSLGRKNISPFIYGINEFNIDASNGKSLNIADRRLGGNRFSTYNWENNASSSPACANDDYLATTAYPLPANLHNQPAGVFTSFHDSSLANNCSSLLTVQMLGFVSRDKNGLLLSNQYAPSQNRLCNVLMHKPANVSPLNTSDSSIYIDEMLQYLVNNYGKTGSSAKAIRNYALDNEPDFWSGVHTCLHPAKQTCAELLSKTVATSTVIKSKDSLSFVFAGVYTWLTHNNFNYATDWTTINSAKTYKRFTEWFLKSMKDSSNFHKTKLIDALDMHYYSKAQGLNNSNTLESVDVGSNDIGIAMVRMQAPRSLWDSTFAEKSNYTSKNNNQSLILLPELQSEINNYYPGTKLSFSEYNFGGGNHISGGIAHTDFLGILANNGVYWANFWNTTALPTIPNYHYAAFRIFRNYDGNFSAFGSRMVKSNTLLKDTLTSVYTSIDDKDSTILHVIAINKDYKNAVNGHFAISSPNKYTSAQVWKFDSLDYNIKQVPQISAIINNSFQYTIPPLTVVHLVLSNTIVTGLNNQNIQADNMVKCFPNPFIDQVKVYSSQAEVWDLQLLDSQGNLLYTVNDVDCSQGYSVLMNHYPVGIYFLKSTNVRLNKVEVLKLIKSDF